MGCRARGLPGGDRRRALRLLCDRIQAARRTPLGGGRPDLRRSVSAPPPARTDTGRRRVSLPGNLLLSRVERDGARWVQRDAVLFSSASLALAAGES